MYRSKKALLHRWFLCRVSAPMYLCKNNGVAPMLRTLWRSIDVSQQKSAAAPMLRTLWRSIDVSQQKSAAAPMVFMSGQCTDVSLQKQWRSTDVAHIVAQHRCISAKNHG